MGVAATIFLGEITYMRTRGLADEIVIGVVANGQMSRILYSVVTARNGS